MWVLVVLLIAGCLIYCVASKDRKSEFEKDRISEAETNILNIRENIISQGYEIDKELTDPECRYILLVDNDSKKWIFSGTYSFDEPEVYDFSDLIDYEIIEDGSTLEKGNLGSAVIGGVLLGAAGAIVGASKTKKTKNVCHKLQLRIYVDDIDEPEKTMYFVSNETNKLSEEYHNAFESIRQFAATLAYIKNKQKAN